jgi:hypothetical protein
MIVVAVGALTFLVALSVLRFESSATAGEQQTQKTVEKSPADKQATAQAEMLANIRAKISEEYVAPVNEQEMFKAPSKGCSERCMRRRERIG